MSLFEGSGLGVFDNLRLEECSVVVQTRDTPCLTSLGYNLLRRKHEKVSPTVKIYGT